MKYLMCFVFLFIFLKNCDSQPLAFPGAEGFGMYTEGGRCGKVIYVSNLNDDGEGSFRFAVNQKFARTIVFQISGTIELQSELKINYGNLTIAGQTAPGDGICIKKYPVIISADNVIVRFIRFRIGYEAKKDFDSFSGKNCSNVIIDHCSISWSVDETASFYDNKNFTMQWCIISESLNHSVHKKGDHGYGGIWGGQGASFHHNLLANHTSRNPRFCGSRYTKKPDEEIVDYRNNVIYNWGFQSVYGGEEGNYNMVNNYYKPGPATKKGDVRFRILALTQFYFDKNVRPDTMNAGNFFIEGNVVEGFENATTDNWKYGVQDATEEQKLKSKLESPITFAKVTTQTAIDAYNSVLQFSGAIFPKRDTIDNRIIGEVKAGTANFGGTWGNKSGIIDSPNDVGGWPELKSLPAPIDSDLDGMPDDWELKHGLNPDNPEDNNLFSMDIQYTNLEIYLNSFIK